MWQKLLSGSIWGPIPLGLFEKAISLSSIPKEKIAVQINSVMFSSFSRLQKDKELLGNWFLKIAMVESATILPILSGLYAISPHFVIVLLGEKWSLCVIPLEILSLAAIFQIFNGLVASLNVGVGDYKNHTLCSIVMTILFVVLCVLARHQGIVAICWVYFYFSSLVRANIQTRQKKCPDINKKPFGNHTPVCSGEYRNGHCCQIISQYSVCREKLYKFHTSGSDRSCLLFIAYYDDKCAKIPEPFLSYIYKSVTEPVAEFR